MTPFQTSVIGRLSEMENDLKVATTMPTDTGSFTPKTVGVRRMTGRKPS